MSTANTPGVIRLFLTASGTDLFDDVGPRVGWKALPAGAKPATNKYIVFFTRPQTGRTHSETGITEVTIGFRIYGGSKDPAAAWGVYRNLEKRLNGAANERTSEGRLLSAVEASAPFEEQDPETEDWFVAVFYDVEVIALG